MQLLPGRENIHMCKISELLQKKLVVNVRLVSYSGEEVGDGHGGGGSVAPFHTAMLTEGNVEALVNRRLVGIVVVWQQDLVELALVSKDRLRGRWKGKGKREGIDR